MKFADLLLESPTDIVARLYKEASADFDKHYNPEDAIYKQKSADYYQKYFKDWYEFGKTPVMDKPPKSRQPKYTVKPGKTDKQSPGYRGLQYAKARAGLEYDKTVQPYKANPSFSFSTQTSDFLPKFNHGGY